MGDLKVVQNYNSVSRRSTQKQVLFVSSTTYREAMLPVLERRSRSWCLQNKKPNQEQQSTHAGRAKEKVVRQYLNHYSYSVTVDLHRAHQVEESIWNSYAQLATQI